MTLLLEQFTRHWWAVALRGLLALGFGLAAFLWPGITLTALVLLFGAYALLDGAWSLAAAWVLARRYGARRWWVPLLEGLLGVAAAIVAVVRPDLTALAFVYLLAAWAVLTGALEIAAAVRLRKLIQNEWLLGLSGAVSVLLGVLMAAWPGAGLVAWTWIIGAFAGARGVLLLALGLRLRRLRRDLRPPSVAVLDPTEQKAAARRPWGWRRLGRAA